MVGTLLRHLDFDKKGLARYLKLQLKKNVLRPSRNLEKAEAIEFTERQVDAVVAKIFREFLKTQSFQSRYFTSKFGQMHYYDSAPDSGQKPLVLLHGIGSSGQCFGWLGAMLAGKRRVVMPDLFHFCGFSKANNPVMNLSEHTESMAEFLKWVGEGKPADFCGLSLGGWIGLKLAAEWPDLVDSLTLLNPAGAKFRAYSLHDTLVYLSWRKFQSLYPGVISAFPYTGTPLVSPVLRRSMFRVLKCDSVRDFVRTVTPEDFVDTSLSRIKCPVLLLWGEKDQFLSSKIPLLLTAKIKNIKAYWVKSCAHILCLETPATVYDQMNRFLGIEDLPESTIAKLLNKITLSYDVEPISKEEVAVEFPQRTA